MHLSLCAMQEKTTGAVFSCILHNAKCRKRLSKQAVELDIKPAIPNIVKLFGVIFIKLG